MNRAEKYLSGTIFIVSLAFLTACSDQGSDRVGAAPVDYAAPAADGVSGATQSAGAAQVDVGAANIDNNEPLLLSNTFQLVTEGVRSGESYFSSDGNRLVYQAEVAGDNPFYQIFIRDLVNGTTTRVSPGIGLTTCAWIHPTLNRTIFASTHEDPDARQKQAEEIAMRESGVERGYAWDYDPHYDIFQADSDGNNLVNLTNAQGYDAEGSYSSDGSKIIFASNRQAYERDLSLAEEKLFEADTAYFMELYIMNADGSDVQQLTFSPGYDGGPFFSADDSMIVWRRFSPDGNSAEIWTMNVDGSEERQLTADGMVSWGPYFHPSGDYIIYSSNLLGHANFELFMIDLAGNHAPVRVTNTEGTDILPVFSPDGSKLVWSSTRTADGSSQVFMADWDDGKARELLGLN